MREIKFRAWDVNLNRFRRPIECTQLVIRLSGKVTDGSTTPNIIMTQYTGLKDKNGKEIYEGDILGDIFEKTYIAYCNKCKQFELHFEANDQCLACSGDVHWCELVEMNNKLEVIGNIYENSDLLKL